MKPDQFTEITFRVANGVAHVTLARPEYRNAWSGRMAVEYRWALYEAHRRDDARVVVLSGSGGDFCVGADTRALSEIIASGGQYTPEKLPLPPFPDDTPPEYRRNHAYALAISTPIVAAINGACAGAGFVLASYADIRIVAHGTRATAAFAPLGLPAEYGLGWLLPRIVGTSNALLLLASTRVHEADELLRFGWAQQVAEPANVYRVATELAEDLARHSSGESLRMMKREVQIEAWTTYDVAYTRSVDDMNAAMRHPDFQTGLRAQRDKRRPDFLADLSPEDSAER
jgi:enoyl-CoA hydratase/carnithine racemase